MTSAGASEQVAVYLAGARHELERVRHWVTALRSVPGLQVSWGACDGPETWEAPGGHPPSVPPHSAARAMFAGLRCASLVWVLWPDDASLCECTAGALAYALAHRWHVGPRLEIIVSGRGVHTSFLAQGADARLADDVLAYEICKKRGRADRVANRGSRTRL